MGEERAGGRLKTPVRSTIVDIVRCPASPAPSPPGIVTANDPRLPYVTYNSFHPVNRKIKFI